MEAYKEWVRRNRQWLSSIESVANVGIFSLTLIGLSQSWILCVTML